MAARWVLRTRSGFLRSAQDYLEGKTTYPLAEECLPDGRRMVVDRSRTSIASVSRVREVAAAIALLEAAHLDVAVVLALRETPWIDDRVAFGLMAAGLEPDEALAHATDETIPDLSVLLGMAALRGVDLFSIYDD